MLGPVRELRALPVESIQWSAVATGIADPGQFNSNDGTHAWEDFELRQQRSELGILRLDHLSHAVKAHGLGRTFKRTKHEHDSSVFTKMRDRFNSAANIIDVGNRSWPQDTQRVQAFRRQINVPAVGGSCRDKEHVLRFNKGSQFVIDHGIDLTHIKTPREILPILLHQNWYTKNAPRNSALVAGFVMVGG